MPTGDYTPNYGGFPHAFGNMTNYGLGSIGTSGYVGSGLPTIHGPIHSSSHPTIDPEALSNINAQLVIIRENQATIHRIIRDLAVDVARLRTDILARVQDGVITRDGLTYNASRVIERAVDGHLIARMEAATQAQLGVRHNVPLVTPRPAEDPRYAPADTIAQQVNTEFGPRGRMIGDASTLMDMINVMQPQEESTGETQPAQYDQTGVLINPGDQLPQREDDGMARAEFLGFRQELSIGPTIMDARAFVTQNAPRPPIARTRPETQQQAQEVTPLHNPDNRNIQPNL